MPSEFQLVNVVAFDDHGDPVLEPLNKWKVSYNRRAATVEIKARGYVRQYDLRSDVAACGVGDSHEKVALGKTLGRVALTGLFHGRYAAGADLRWGGVSRNEIHEFFLMFDDTTTLSMELDGDEYDEFSEQLPERARADDAQQRMERLLERIQAMVADGPRVLTELNGQRIAIQAEIEQQKPLIDGGATFDARHGARTRSEELTRSLNDVNVVRQAVLYDLAASGAVKLPATRNSPAIAAISPVDVRSPSAKPTKRVEAPAAPTKRKCSFLGKVVKLVVALVGAGAGVVAAAFVVALLGPQWSWLAIPVCVILGAWLAVNMLNALMRR